MASGKGFIENILKQDSPLYQGITDFGRGGGGASAFAKDLGKDAVGMAKEVTMGGFKKGGKVKKTGVYKLHEGERVLTKKQTRTWDRNK